MTFDWQQMATLAIVALAVAYVGRLGWRTFVQRKAAACGGGCKSCAAGGEPEVVAIGSLPGNRNGESVGH
jgi:hypothetical protein